jgi:hypothetical protein
MGARWNAMLAGHGFGKLEMTVRGGQIQFVKLKETTEVQAGELRPLRENGKIR